MFSLMKKHFCPQAELNKVLNDTFIQAKIIYTYLFKTFYN